MKKITQNTDQLLSGLSSLETDWKDDFALKVIEVLNSKIIQNSLDESHLILFRDLDVTYSLSFYRDYFEMVL